MIQDSNGIFYEMIGKGKINPVVHITINLTGILWGIEVSSTVCSHGMKKHNRPIRLQQTIR